MFKGLLENVMNSSLQYCKIIKNITNLKNVDNLVNFNSLHKGYNMFGHKKKFLFRINIRNLNKEIRYTYYVHAITAEVEATWLNLNLVLFLFSC